MKLKISTTCISATPILGYTNILIAAFGYESRAALYTKSFIDLYGLKDYLIVDFQDFKIGLGRKKNEQFLSDMGIQTLEITSADYDLFIEKVEAKINSVRALNCQPIAIHVDYSCMPRSWYCGLATRLAKFIKPNEDQLLLWYTPGLYNPNAFEPSGIDDFDVFLGQASLSPSARTHILGLGFESVRAQAILTVIDPEYMICYYAHPGLEAVMNPKMSMVEGEQRNPKRLPK
jgi:hypothetical protein